MRNLAAYVGVASLFFLIVFAIDPLVSGTRPKITLILALAGAFILSASISTFFHLRFLTRE